MQRSIIFALAVLAFGACTMQATAQTTASFGRFNIVKTNGTVDASDLNKGKGPEIVSFFNVTIKRISSKFATVELVDADTFSVTWNTTSKGRPLLRKPVYVTYFAETSKNTTIQGTVLVKFWPRKQGVSSAEVDTATFWFDFTTKVTKTLEFSNSTTADITVEDINNATAKTRTFKNGKKSVPELVEFTEVEAVLDWYVDAELVDPTTFSVTVEKRAWTVYLTPIAITANDVNGTEVDGLIWVNLRRPRPIKGL